jgi:hypothetical protein
VNTLEKMGYHYFGGDEWLYAGDDPGIEETFADLESKCDKLED